MSDLRFAAPKERRVALITGGARGIGRAAAIRIAEEGRDIIIADILHREAGETVAAIEALGQDALYIETDVSDEAAVHTAVQQAVERFGRLDILVTSAGVGRIPMNAMAMKTAESRPCPTRVEPMVRAHSQRPRVAIFILART